MDTIYDYFTTIPSSHRSMILIGGIAFFWLIESIVPLFHFNYNKLKHAGINFFFTLTTIVINFALAYILLSTSDWTQANSFGFLAWFGIDSIGLKMIVGLLFMDLIGAYFAHWTEHQVKVLWGFHIVHHSDNEVDTTSANRHHPLESIVRFIFTCLAAFIVGAPVGIIMLYQSISVVLSQFNHANILLPNSIDKWLSWLIVTPNMHKSHHHQSLPYTDSNYGNIFGFWDRLFGTYLYLDPKLVEFGLDTYPDKTANKSIYPLLKSAFNKYRSSKG